MGIATDGVNIKSGLSFFNLSGKINCSQKIRLNTDSGLNFVSTK